jgi:hypothetical protein
VLAAAWFIRGPHRRQTPSLPTLIEMGRLTMNIEDIKPGDFVVSRDDVSGHVAPKRVLRVFRSMNHHLRILQIKATDGEVQTIKTTNDHPIWVSRVGWVEAGKLQVGQQLHQHDGTAAEVVSTTFEFFPEGVPVFNVEVEGYHTYFVAGPHTRAPPIWVHNKPMGIPRSLPPNARTTSFRELCIRLQKYHGIGPHVVTARLHRIKYDYGIPPNESLIFDLTGNVYLPKTLEWIGCLTQGGTSTMR